MNNKYKFYFFIFLLLPAHILRTQPTTYNDYLNKYNQAKTYYFNKEYIKAKDLLSTLISSNQTKDAFTPYIQFYYALAVYYNGEKTLAKDTFITILKNFPTWHQLDEVIYWLGQIHFEEGNYVEALTFLNKTTSKKVNKKIIKMKNYFLSQIDDLEKLQEILKNIPDDQCVINILYQKAVEQAFVNQDFSLVHELKKHYNIAELIYNPLNTLRSIKKTSYNIAIFLPFLIDEIDYENTDSPQFVLDLYQGIQIGKEWLKREGIFLNIFSYDTKKDAGVTAALLEQKQMLLMDLIIGPLYPNTMPLVIDFSKKNCINLFNPISVNTKILRNNPFAFLFQPSLETQAKKVADFMWQDILQDSIPLCDVRLGIFYGTRFSDSLQAHIYKKHIEEYTDKEINVMLQINEQEATNFLTKFKKNKREYKMYFSGLTHVYIASQNKLVVSNILSVLEELEIRPCIIGHEDWITKNIISFNELNHPRYKRLKFLAPNYINYEQDSVHIFREAFFHKTAQYPTYYAYVGYEMIIFLGKMLSQHGTYFQKHWGEERCYEGMIFSGISYGKYHTNQYLPLINFNKSKLVISNQY